MTGHLRGASSASGENIKAFLTFDAAAEVSR